MKVIRTSLPGVVIIEPTVFRDRRGTFSETFSEREFERMIREAASEQAGIGADDMVRPGAGDIAGNKASDGMYGGASVRFVQDNESHSAAGVVRGLHFQKPPHAQAKLVRVIAGRILDVAVDMRQGSPTLGEWVAVELSAENRRQLFIPRGFAHGFVVPQERTDEAADTIVMYKVDGYYAPECDGGVLWNDPALGIDWGIEPHEAIVSDKDAALPLFADAFKFRT